MNHFKVWLRLEGGSYQITLEGARNGRWLRKYLLKQGIKPALPRDLEGTNLCTFRVPMSRHLKFDRLQELISAISEVQLMFGVRP